MTKTKRVLYISLIVSSILMFIGGTYAFLATRIDTSNNNTSVAVTDNVNIEFSDNKTLMYDNLYPASEMKATTSAYVGATNGTCKDENSHNICSLYEFTVTNKSEVSQKLAFTLNITQNKLKNLKYKIFESNNVNITSSSSIREYTTSLTQHSLDSLPLTGLTSILNGNNDGKTFTIMFWIEQQSYDQTAVDAGKQFDANITVNTLSTGNLVSGTNTDGCFVYEGDTLEAFTGLNEDGSIKPICSNYIKDIDNTDNYSYNIIIPSTVNGERITTLGPKLFSAIETVDTTSITALNNYQYISKITVAEGITTISDASYSNMITSNTGTSTDTYGTFLGTGITTGLIIKLPNSLTTIGAGSFIDAGLTTINIPENVTTISSYAFATYKVATQSLEEVLFNGTLKNSNLTINNYVFYTNEGITQNLSILELPANIKTINEYAFYNNNITEVIIPTYDGNVILQDNWIDNDVTISYSGMVPRILLTDAIFTKAGCKDNCPTVTEANLKNVTSSTGEVGLYQSSDTLNDNPTYYYRGAVDNNYVSFGTHDTDIWYGYYSTTATYPSAIYSTESACRNASSYNKNCTRKVTSGEPIIWRIIRINEDGTIRLISELGVMSKPINTLNNNFSYMYYSNGNSEGKAYYELDTSPTSWYKNNLSRYEDKIAQSTYCEAARVKYMDFTSGNAEMQLYDEYEPTFKCAIDGNNKGQVNSKVGLITYDEVVYAGGYYYDSNSTYYLNNSTYFWTMSPAGLPSYTAAVWIVYSSGYMNDGFVSTASSALRPVISLTSDILVTGEGTIDNPYVVQ